MSLTYNECRIALRLADACQTKSRLFLKLVKKHGFTKAYNILIDRASRDFTWTGGDFAYILSYFGFRAVWQFPWNTREEEILYFRQKYPASRIARAVRRSIKRNKPRNPDAYRPVRVHVHI